ncbi:family 20 glycosylhydrolase [Polaribacter sp. BAL334]|uniref:beta-N-acetylhexosaminidase n=1 Tax=Polaribacter sp. BAL334 TaxID=1708178 RepID=UPI0018D266FB|nr:family 20 glycosylhydrolase [Polaribacter sp. BAL334]MBG7613051.1 family 20 glycosylhydrolase [Polaribacter sp. BAL334]
MKIQSYFILFFLLGMVNCQKKEANIIQPNIIPKPLFQQLNNGVFELNEATSLETIQEFGNVAQFLKSYVKEQFHLKISSKKSDTKILFIKDHSIKNEEGYLLKIDKNKIEIRANSSKGAFYAVQSLIQLLPIENKSTSISIQCLEIQDAPQFAYRGMHLDVARHFFSVDFIKKQLDLMALLKMNTFHWHLTEDQGWRIEIKKYPKLQEIAAFRNETLIGHYSDEPHQFDGKKYGGFYTQKEIKEIVKYASERQITVIPEIEMPGHSQAAIAAYPELGCTGNQLEVATKWGVFEDIYCTKETTFQFLEDVIDEVVPLFPGKYIHIGGDEAPKSRWKNCAHCQKVIKKEGLKDEHELQSYFIKRMEKYINSKGKQIIGWDEILEGGLAPNATVMSWRGNVGAIEAAKQQHDVILTPNSHCYFDYYQSDNENEPLAIGGFLPLEKVYDFNPIPEELTKEEAKFVLGAQGNVWTEYMSTPEKVEYMVFPRIIALAEVVWSAKEHKNYDDFIRRLEFFNKRLDAKNVQYANHLYEVKGEFINKNEKVFYEFETITKGKDIRFTTDNSEPNSNSKMYEKPIFIEKSQTLKAAVFNKEGTKLGSIFEQKINLHKAVGAKITLNVAPHKAYNAGGTQALINGISGNNKRFGDKEWLGFSGDDVEITIEFDKPTEINSIFTRFHNGNGQWIYAPKKVLLYRDDSKYPFEIKLEKNKDLLVSVIIIGQHMKAKKIKIFIPNYGIIPEGKQGAGNKAWTFIDEIIIE